METNTEIASMFRKVARDVLLGVIDQLRNERDASVGRVEAIEAQIETVRQALGGYKDSDLASLATTIAARLAAVEAELEQTREYVDGLLGNADPAEPLVDRVGHLVLTANCNTKPAACAAGNYTNDAGRGYDFEFCPDCGARLGGYSTTPSESHAAADSSAVDALARRVDALEGFTVMVNRATAKQLEIEEQGRDQVQALRGIVRKLDDATAEQVARLIERVDALARRVDDQALALERRIDALEGMVAAVTQKVDANRSQSEADATNTMVRIGHLHQRVKDIEKVLRSLDDSTVEKQMPAPGAMHEVCHGESNIG